MNPHILVALVGGAVVLLLLAWGLTVELTGDDHDDRP